MNEINNSKVVQGMVGSRIKRAREDAQLTRKELALQLLTHPDYPEAILRKGTDDTITPDERLVSRIKQWELGTNPVGLEFIPLICEILHCDVGFLFGDYEEHYHFFADVSAITGLSEINVARLMSWQQRFDFHLKDVANVCVESAFQSLEDYIHLDVAKMNLGKCYSSDLIDRIESGNEDNKYLDVLLHLQVEENANERGYTMLRHKDAIRFYARSVANTLERYLEEVYSAFQDTITRYNADKREDQKLPAIPFHGLRHTSATLLIASKQDVRTVSSRLGHAQASTTMNIYAHALQDTDRKAVNALESMLVKRA